MEEKEFPWLTEDMRIEFPQIKPTSGNIIASGGNLSPGMLLSAYEQGIFPWFSEHEPLLWWSPKSRFILLSQWLRTPKRLSRHLKNCKFSYSFDRNFEQVIARCAEQPRPNQEGTWISHEMQKAYTDMHTLGYAHSLEVWAEDRLVGGLYGISLGKCFFGESMFSLVSHASKAGFIKLVETLGLHGFELFDCQVHSAHLQMLGAKEADRKEFLNILKKGLTKPGIKGSWAGLQSLPV